MSSHNINADEVESKRVREKMRRDGYSEIAIDHWLNPRNLGQLENYEGYSEKITGPCGDMWIWLKIKGDVIQNATYISDICVGGVSAGSILTEMAKGKTVEDALHITADDILRALGGLPRNFKHCARLAETALKAAIANYSIYKAEPWRKLYQQKY